MPERLECEVLQKVRYINTLTFLPFTYLYELWLFLVTRKHNYFCQLHIVEFS